MRVKTWTLCLKSVTKLVTNITMRTCFRRTHGIANSIWTLFPCYALKNYTLTSAGAEVVLRRDGEGLRYKWPLQVSDADE
jgi:hypothetical protein